MELSRKDKLRIFGFNKDLERYDNIISNEVLDLFYDNYLKSKIKNLQIPSHKLTKQRESILLEFLNKILECLNINHINNFTDFKEISFDDLEKIEIKNIADQMEFKIFGVFPESKKRIYRNKWNRTYDVKNLIKYLVEYVDCKLVTGRRIAYDKTKWIYFCSIQKN